MLVHTRTAWVRVIFTVLLTGFLGLSLSSLASAGDPDQGQKAIMSQQDIKKVQETLRDRGYQTGPVDGVMGPRTREAIRQYQKAENLPVTGDLDAESAGKLGVGQESVGGSFRDAGQEVVEGGKEAGHEMMQGKPIAAGKEMGKGIGRAGEKVGEGVKEVFSPESDRGEREAQETPESQDSPQ